MGGYKEKYLSPHREAFNRHNKIVHLNGNQSVSSIEVEKEIEAANKILERVAVADNMVVVLLKTCLILTR